MKQKLRLTILCFTVVALMQSAAAHAYTLRLTTDRGCYRVGETIVVLLSMQNVSPTAAAGFQARLGYDATHLQFTGWSYPSAPFGLPVLNSMPVVNPTSGIIDLAGGIDIFASQSPTSLNSVVGVLTFTVLGPLDYTTVPVWFRSVGADPPNVPTRLSALGGAALTPLTTIDANLIAVSSAMRGDANCDGIVNNFDIDFFVTGLLYIGFVPAPPQYLSQFGTQTCWDGRLCWGDINSDQLFNNFDIDPFVACILTPPPPAVPCP